MGGQSRGQSVNHSHRRLPSTTNRNTSNIVSLVYRCSCVCSLGSRLSGIISTVVTCQVHSREQSKDSKSFPVLRVR